MSSDNIQPLGPERTGAQPHDHAVLVYRRDRSLREGLGAFLGEGHRNNDLCVFVHALDSEKQARHFATTAHNAGEALDDAGRLRVAHHRDAFEVDGRIHHAHVAEVVAGLMEEAAAQEADGLRIFVDASHVYFEAGRDEEWFEFEAWLGRQLEHACSLVCAYRHGHLNDPGRLKRVLSTHAYRYGPGASTA